MEPAVRLEPRAEPPPRAPPPPQAVTSRRRLWLDRAAGRVVRAGGILVVASLIAILVCLVLETAPLFTSARGTPARAIPMPNQSARAFAVEPRASYLAAAGADGHVRVLALATGEIALDLSPGVTRPESLFAPPGDS